MPKAKPFTHKGEELAVFLSRGVAAVIPKTEVAARLSGTVPLRIKFGLDPTNADLHLGYVTVLRRLRKLQDRGHTAVIVLGTFTGRFGDPGGRTEKRRMRDARELAALAKVFPKGLLKILDPTRTEITFNSTWYDRIKLDEFFRIAAHFTAGQLLERDMFAARKKAGKEIYLQELLYPILQAYDSVAIRADLTVIGSDQLFNELAARKLQHAFGQEPQGLVALRILPGTDGREKMSQSLGNTIGILEDPVEKFGKLMSMPDNTVVEYAELLTDLAVPPLRRAVTRGGSAARDAKVKVAYQIVKEIDGALAAQNAQQAFTERFRLRKLPADLSVFRLRGHAQTILEVLVDASLAPSKSFARRIIAQGGVRVDGIKVTDERVQVSKGATLQVGKRSAVRIV